MAEKRDWEPQPGDHVVELSGRYNPVAVDRKVARLTATQIILEPLNTYSDPTRYRRASGRSYNHDYPDFERVGDRTNGRWGTRPRLHHPQSQGVLNAKAGEARQERINAVLKADERFRYHRDAATAKALQKALSEFIEHEEGTSGE